MRKPVHIPRPKHKTPAQLKRIPPNLVLTMPTRAGPFPACEIIPPQHVQQISHSQIRDSVRFSLFIDQQWKIDPCLFLKNPRIISVPQADRRQPCTFVLELLLVLAQLRDVLSAKDSPIVPQKYHHRRLLLPQRP